MNNQIKINDFIHGSYKFGVICGKVLEVKKGIVIIEKYDQYYEDYTPTGLKVNVTISRIREINNCPVS